MTMMEESVYALIPPAQYSPERPPRHTSKFATGQLDETTLVYPMGIPKRTGSHASFGLPNGMSAKCPLNFTRAHATEPILPAPAPPTTRKPKLRDATPLRNEKPLMNLKTDKNFVTTNAVEAILSKPLPTQKALPFTMRPAYGKVPNYLTANKLKIAAEQAHVEEYLKMKDAQETSTDVSQMAEQERLMLLGHLKVKWSSVNTAYQKLPFTLDTPSKQKRKESLEQQLADIEQDIQLLSKGEVVLVVNDC